MIEYSISVILPAYNEEDNIKKTVDSASLFLDSSFSEWEIIVVNDGSSDNTGEIINKTAGKDKRIKPIHHSCNKGYGGALKSGIEASEKELLFFTDSDGQFDISELKLMIDEIENYDIAAGYRRKRKDPLYRKINMIGWNILARILFGLKIRDINCAFKLFKKKVFDNIKIDANGAMINIDILVQAVNKGFRIKEIPVTHFPRACGKQSGANIKVIFNAFKELFELYKKLSSASVVTFLLTICQEYLRL